MDGSDDYFFDDIVLDDQTLAILDQSEQRYLKEASAAVTAVVLPNEPVSKRLKTTTGWVPGSGASCNVDDELPEISLQGDGTYSVNNRANYHTKDVGQVLVRPTRQSNLPGRPAGAPSNTNQRNIQTAQSSGSHPTNLRPPQLPHNVQRQRNQSNYNHNHDRSSRTTACSNAPNSATLAQLAELQKKLDELRDENSKMKAELQHAIDIKLAKDGEVSILRKSIEKNAQNHAAQILQLKAEKDKVDLKQLQTQKEMKDEIERLRTQFVFRQQELESTIRKQPVSVRAKKLGREFPSTPLPLPAAISGWNRGSARPMEETPVRPARPPSIINKISPSKQGRKSPKKIKNGMLPGFENAFETSTPRKSPSKIPGKGKEMNASVFNSETTNGSFLPSQLFQGPSQFQFGPMGRHSDCLKNFTLHEPSGPGLADQSQVLDVEMDATPMESDEDIPLEEIESMESINWKAELCRILLTHSYGSLRETSFQQVLGSSHSTATNNHATLCGRILEVISNSTRSDDYDDAINIVSVSFLSLLVTLSEGQSQSILTIIFNLLTKLIVSLPTFQTNILACQLPLNNNQPSTIVEVVCSTILKYLNPKLSPPPQDDLASETLSLLDSLCFRVDVKAMERLQSLAQNREALMTLIHPSQPFWFLERSSRLLVFLSSYHDLYKVLLDMSDEALANPEVQIKDTLVERLCSHLVDTNQSAASTVKTHILTYFAQSSISHPGAHSILGTSHTLIPSLVLYISQLTSPLWEDDGSLACSPQGTSSIIAALNEATFLLYHLIFGVDPNLNLRHALQHAPHRPFNSISHIFVVTFGRLSYSEPPSWIEPSRRQDLEFLSEIAREILEVVVDGPEGDSVWAAFQSEPDDDNMIDEEEMEAQLMGIGVG